MLSTTVLSRAILRVTEGGVKASIHRSIWEQVFLPIGQQTRDMAKVIVDGLFARMSEGVAALGLYIWLSRIPVLDADVDLSWISWMIAQQLLCGFS